ncbi:MAG: aspartyl protease family protein [Rhizomicrobium sp.]
MPILSAVPAHAAMTADGVLRANRAAAGKMPASGTALFQYAFHGEGLTGTASSIQDVATGAYVDSEDAGAIGQGAGFDGKTPWMRDLSGAFTAQEGGDRIAVANNEAYRNANLWWRADRGGADIRYAGRETVDGKAADHLIVVPRNGKPFDAWFDARTHLLARIAEDRQFLHTRMFYSDYRKESGVEVPHKIVIDNGVGPAAYDTLTLKTVTWRPAQPLSNYSRPTAPPTGAMIDSATVTVPFRLLNNHIYLQAMVDGKGPYTFILDTGGHTLLSPRIIKEAGLKSVGNSVGTGAGKGSVVSGFVRYHEIAIGGVKLHDQTGIAQNVYDKSIEGIPVDGMVGFELIRRMVTRIDYGSKTLTFIDPAKFAAVGAGTAVPFKFYDHLPQVAGRAGDVPGIFDIDTGSRSEVDITSPSVDRYKLRQKYPHGVEAITGWGVGGPVKSYVARLPSLTLGGFTEPGVVADLDGPNSGSMSDPNFLGNVGSGFLKRFVVTLDYARQTMYLKPIEPPPADIGTFDRSGMWINAADDGFKITYVSSRGPADEAGLQAGDVITEIDGKPVKPDELAKARAQFRMRPAGSMVTINYMRNGAAKHTLVTLRNQV